MKEKLTNEELFKWLDSLEQDELDIVKNYADGWSEKMIFEEYGDTQRVRNLIGTYQYYEN